MKRLIKVFSLLKQALGFTTVFVRSRHYKNLNSSPVIDIDGKAYVKIKLRFVDTLDANGEKMMANLEEEVASLRQQLVPLQQKHLDLQVMLSDVEMLNKNLMHKLGWLKILEVRHKELQDSYYRLQYIAQSKLDKREKKLAKQQHTIASLEALVNEKMQELQSKDAVVNLLLAEKAIEKEKTDRMVKSMKNAMDECEFDLVEKNKIIRQNQLMIKSLSDRLFEMKSKVN